MGHRFNKHWDTYLKTQSDFLNRNLARTLYKPGQDRLQTAHHRNLWGLRFQKGIWRIQNDLAFLKETYEYYPDKNKTLFDISSANVYLVKNNIALKFSETSHLYIGNTYTYQSGVSDHFATKNRTLWATHLVWGQKRKKFRYDIKLRKEFSPHYDIPLVGSIETAYRMHRFWKLKANLSKNFKLPTFNDLFWEPFGNPDLKPEESYSYEAGLQFKHRHTDISLSFFYIDSRNLIKWTPDNNQWWSPKNMALTQHKGLEVNFQHKIKWQDKQSLDLKADYTFQQPVDLTYDKIIPYVPQHTGLISLIYIYKRVKIKYINRFTGKIFTTASNTKFIPAHDIHNLALYYTVNSHLKLGGQINNIWNTYYETFPSRPQPGRNFNLYINFKI